MRILANENFPLRLVTALRLAGHDVTWVRETHPSLSDVEVLERACTETRIVATFDKDFGALVFESGVPAPAGIILVRINPMSKSLLPRVPAALQSPCRWQEHLATVEPDRTRLRALPTR